MDALGDEDEDLLLDRREELLGDFEEWAETFALEVDAAKAEVALDWKIGAGDARLTTWTVDDLAEFALAWCPRSLSMPAREAPHLLAELAEFFTFLAARGLLEGAGPEQLRSWCTRHAADVEAAMADPRRFGPAKRLLHAVDALEDPPEDQADLERRIAELQALAPDEFDALVARGDGGPDDLGLPPVQRPAPEEVADSAARAPIIAQMARLAQFCAVPGRTLTAKGNPKVADALTLAEELDAPRVAEPRGTKPRSIDDFPELDWLLRVALRARVVRRQRGKLVAVAAWSKLDAPTMVDRLADAALCEGLDGWYGAGEDLEDALDEESFSIAVALLGARSTGPLDIERFGRAFSEAVLGADLGDWRHEHRRGAVHRILDRLERCGVVVQHDVDRSTERWGLPAAVGGTAEPTAVGVGVLIGWVEMTGAVVPDRPDPSSGTAEELLGLVGRVPVEQWREMSAAWAGAREDARERMAEALADPDRPSSLTYSTLEELEPALGREAAHAVVRALLGGRWDGLAAMWLAERGDSAIVDAEPLRALHGMVDLIAGGLDDAGPEQVVAMLPAGGAEGPLEDMWRLDHPRVREVLEIVGRTHPDRTVAKTARRSLAKLRSRG
ncbi:hypothetical protein [Actinomycetospora soli]|uniref:hypothetical protein n=1 Tax=Actinomycetospora soli TaxID=2893887 RepID=UPI001E3CD605|nr:hypothetical protein [Actinomycetospora soli]MCD2187884.1 hypothetical protein [Actinomycetospora soli]